MSAKQKATHLDFTALFSMKITVRKGHHCLSKLVNFQGPEPPSFTSRGRWPILTWKIAKVQVFFVLNSETISPSFMNLSNGHNRNRVWNMLGKRVWSDKGGHLKLSNHGNCWNEERYVIGKNSNHKYPAYPQDQIEQMLTTNAITQAERKFLVSQNALTSISHKDDLTSNLSWDDQAKW